MARRCFTPQHRPGKWSGVLANVEAGGDSPGSGGVSLSSSLNFPEPVSRSTQGLHQAQGQDVEWTGRGFPRVRPRPRLQLVDGAEGAGRERGWLGHVGLSLAALKPFREEDGAGFLSRR